MNKAVETMMVRHNNYRMNKKRMVLFALTVFILLLIFSLYFASKTVTAERNTNRVKKVTSIEIKSGDSLWSIASNYLTDEYDDINQYIDEIKDSNGIYDDTIHVGNYIIVPYYADASLH